MGFSKEKIKQIGGLLVFAAVLVLLVMHSSLVYRGILFSFDILKPFIIYFVFLINYVIIRNDLKERGHIYGPRITIN